MAFASFFKKTVEQVERIWKPRAPRLPLSPLHHVEFKITPAEDHVLSGAVPIANLSTTGIGFIKGACEWPVAGTFLEGELHVGSKLFPVTVKVIFHRADTIGCAFHTPTLQTDEGIARYREIAAYFKLEIAALSLAKVPEESLEKDVDGTPHWFTGPDGAELYYVEKDGVIVHFHFTFLGSYIEGERGNIPRLGALVEAPTPLKPQHKSSTLVQFYTTFDPEIKAASLRFLSHVKGISPTHLSQLQGSLQQIPS